MSLVSNPKPGDDVSVRQAIARLGSSKLGPTSTPTFLGVTTTSLTISGLTENSVLFAGASGLVSQDNTNFTFNDSTNTLDVNGITISGTRTTGLDMSGGTFATAAINAGSGDIITTGLITAATFNATNEDDILQVDGSCLLRTGASANSNIFLGIDVFADSDGTNNIGIGFKAGENIDDSGGKGINNVFIGRQAGRGAVGGNTGDKNVCIGVDSGIGLVSGNENFLIGFSCGTKISSASYNVLIGATNGQQLTTQSRNVGIGRGCLRDATSTDNTIIGNLAGFEIKTGGSNVFIGSSTGQNSTGANNLFLGRKAGINQTTNSNLLIIDNQDRGSAALELTDTLIYGVMNATPASQTIRFNVGDLIQGNPTHSDADGGGAMVHSWIREDGAGTPSTAATLTVSHDGAVANDQLAKMVLDVNTGAGVVERLRLDTAGVKIAGMTTGSVLFTGASGLVSQDNGGLFWDDSFNVLGIGTNTPDQGNTKLHLFHADSHCKSIIETGLADKDATLELKTVNQRWQFTTNAGEGDKFIFFDATRIANVIVLDLLGNVGINTTTPDAKLQVVGDCKFGDDNTNYASFASDGELTLTGTARVIISQDLEPILATRPIANPPGEGTEDGFLTHDFNATTDESVYFHLELSHNYADAGTIHIHFDFFVDTAPTSAESVVWGVEYKKQSIGDNFDFGTGTTTAYTQTPITTGTPANDKKTHQSGEVSLVTTGFVAGDYILLRLFRDANGTGGTDDYSSDARVIDYHIEYLSDKLGEAT